MLVRVHTDSGHKIELIVSLPSSQLCDLESSRDPRHQAASGQPIPEQERAALQKDIQEQEALLQGYQKVWGIYVCR
jgi:hypothetical protein